MASTIKFTDLQKLDICKKYISGINSYELAILFKCSNVTISNILKSNNIEIRNNKKFSVDIEKQICEEYLNNTKTLDLSKKFNSSVTAIINVLKRNNIKLKTNGEAHKKYEFNENYFNKINSEDKAYWLGWLYSDGCNQKNHNISIGLNKKDIHIIELFKKYINSNRPVYYKKKNIIELCLRSEIMSKSLFKVGCIYRKSLTLAFPTSNQVPKKFIFHFIRGYFEGDGCIGIYDKKFQLSILGTKRFLSLLKNILEEEGVGKISLKQKTQNTYSLNICNKKDIIKIRELLYENYLKNNKTNSELILNRKFEKLSSIEM